MELFKEESLPLAYRMCPKTLDEYVGQRHILGPGKLLRRAIESDRITSLILYGPPGTGKTALARIIAEKTKAHFEWLNAATIGLDEIRKVIQHAKARKAKGIHTIVFLDEIHRFNKLQQDALLPDVEEGNITLIAACSMRVKTHGLLQGALLSVPQKMWEMPTLWHWSLLHLH